MECEVNVMYIPLHNCDCCLLLYILLNFVCNHVKKILPLSKLTSKFIMQLILKLFSDSTVFLPLTELESGTRAMSECGKLAVLLGGVWEEVFGSFLHPHVRQTESRLNTWPGAPSRCCKVCLHAECREGQ